MPDSTGPSSPDATSIRAVAVPATAPPFDDMSLPTGSGRARPARAAMRSRPAERPAQPPPRQAQPIARPSSNDGAWPSRFAQALAETLAGARPPDQIAPWTTEQARKRIGQLGPLLSAAHRPRVRRVLVTSPASGVLEMTVIVTLGPRVRALAVRLERADRVDCGVRGRLGMIGPAGRPQLAAATSPGAASRPCQTGSRAPRGRLDETARWRCTAVEAA